MAIWRVIYPMMDDWKLMRIYEVPAGQSLAVPKTCSKMLEEEWANAVAGIGGVEQDLIDALQITEVQDMR